MAGEKIVFFDGVCSLCSASVQFLIRHDKASVLRYASLQSQFATIQLKSFDLQPADLKSIVFLDEGNCYTRSEAVVRLMKYMKGPYRMLYAFRFVPQPIRDFLYNIVARNRYRLFGKKNVCWMPDPSLKALFLD